MSAAPLAGRLLTPAGWREGSLLVEDGRIAALREGPAPNDRLILPGFVDLHVHGGGGADVMDGAEGIARAAAFHLRHGTTALCPTTVTAPAEALRAALAAAAALEPDAPERARLLGVHLEGPFISEQRRGAQPPFARTPDPTLLEDLLATGPVAVVTLAPELPGALELIRGLRARGVRASLGHTDCTLAEARAAFAAGAGGVTHLFNAMSGLHHRRPGLALAALEAEHAFHELILDGQHVHPALLHLALRAAPASTRLLLVSDAIRATGLPDGPTELGGQAVTVCEGRATLADGTLAGSVLTLDRALRNALDAGLTLEQAAPLLTENPADALGRADLGRLAPGALADAVVLDPGDLAVRAVVRGGRAVDLG